MCDNCSNGNNLAHVDITEETKTIVKIIKEHHFSKGFTYGMEKTVALIKTGGGEIFKSMTKGSIKELLEILIAKNILVRNSKGNYFVICVGNKDITKMFPITARIKPDIVVPIKPKQSSYAKRVHEIRTTISERLGIIPTIFINDRVLMNICNSKPKDVSQLWKVDGISDEFIVKYGTEFINEINIVSKNKSSDNGSSGSKDITYKHYKDGKTMNEISELTGRKLRTIEDHMIYIFENYDDVVIDTDYFGLTEEFKSEINDSVKKV